MVTNEKSDQLAAQNDPFESELRGDEHSISADAFNPTIVAPALQRISTCLMIIAGILLMYALYWLRPVLVPFVVSLFVVSGIAPLMRLLEKRLGLKRFAAIGITFLFGLVLITGLMCCLWLSIQQISTQGKAYANRVEQMFGDMQQWMQEHAIPKLSLSSFRNSEESEAELAAQVSENAAVNARHADLLDMVDQWVSGSLATLSAELLTMVSSFAVVSIFVFFLLLGELNSSSESLVGKIDYQMRSYMLVKTAISAVTGFIFGLTLWLFGVPMALTFGLLAFLLNYIPNFGPLVATALPVPFIVLLPEASIGWMVAAIAASGGVQLISGNLVEPKLMGDSAGLHPITIMLGLMFWGMLWGIIGMFLATPIMAAMRIIFQRSASTRPLADLMSGTWPEPAEGT
ncbi:AI-2E family transporter [Roseiconus lacunae]|uniref:AI-2E family transporter n=1 Tax=Roseiconus lacunae TaxID=2605694 RepID=UPI001F1577A1|nr:AI-2E family transporter [Roseiconus lacunae]WRQ49379.1 AI-2E family transporter [Stieleria sp. HD01]